MTIRQFFLRKQTDEIASTSICTHLEPMQQDEHMSKFASPAGSVVRMYAKMRTLEGTSVETVKPLAIARYTEY